MCFFVMACIHALKSHPRTMGQYASRRFSGVINVAQSQSDSPFSFQGPGCRLRHDVSPCNGCTVVCNGLSLVLGEWLRAYPGPAGSYGCRPGCAENSATAPTRVPSVSIDPLSRLNPSCPDFGNEVSTLLKLVLRPAEFARILSLMCPVPHAQSTQSTIVSR